MTIEVGVTASAVFTVSDADTAVALGSGDVPVLATPRLVAWMEAVTVQALAGHLGDGETTVGTRVEIDHLSASPIGAEITIEVAVIESLQGSVGFDVQAWQGPDRTAIARGTVRRAVVDRARFLRRAGAVT